MLKNQKAGRQKKFAFSVLKVVARRFCPSQHFRKKLIFLRQKGDHFEKTRSDLPTGFIKKRGHLRKKIAKSSTGSYHQNVSACRNQKPLPPYQAQRKWQRNGKAIL